MTGDEGISDKRIAQLFARHCQKVRQWQHMTETDEPWFEPMPGSQLAFDDELSDPYQTSHAAQQSILAAVDHLHALVVLVEDARALHAYAPFTLLRAAIESAATAMWLLRPEDRIERVERTLNYAWADIRDGNSAAEAAGAPVNRSLGERSTQIKDIASAAGLSRGAATKGLNATLILKEADSLTGRPGGALVAWKLGSGFAHGRRWASLSANDREVLLPINGDVVTLRITSKMSTVAFMLMVACELTKTALDWGRVRRTSTDVMTGPGA